MSEYKEIRRAFLDGHIEMFKTLKEELEAKGLIATIEEGINRLEEMKTEYELY